MEIIRNQVNESLVLPQNYLSLYEEMNFAIFDIETTGLNSNFNEVILIGLLYRVKDQIFIEQFFCHNRKEEFEMLVAFREKIEHFDLLINYNGNSFDIPFLNRRFAKHKIPFSLGSHKSLDLLKLIRRCQNKLQLDNLKLKSLERYLGIHRNDTISGKDSVELYKQYEDKQYKQLKDLILLHNFDDLYYLGKSLKIMDQIPIEEIITCLPSIITVGKNEFAYIQKQMIKGGTLHVDGFFKGKSASHYMSFNSGFNFNYNGQNYGFQIEIPLYKGCLSSGTKCLYIHQNDFPFDYHPTIRIENLSPDILIVKEGPMIHIQEIHFFISSLVKHIFQ